MSMMPLRALCMSGTCPGIPDATCTDRRSYMARDGTIRPGTERTIIPGQLRMGSEYIITPGLAGGSRSDGAPDTSPTASISIPTTARHTIAHPITEADGMDPAATDLLLLDTAPGTDHLPPDLHHMLQGDVRRRIRISMVGQAIGAETRTSTHSLRTSGRRQHGEAPITSMWIGMETSFGGTIQGSGSSARVTRGQSPQRQRPDRPLPKPDLERSPHNQRDGLRLLRRGKLSPRPGPLHRPPSLGSTATPTPGSVERRDSRIIGRKAEEQPLQGPVEKEGDRNQRACLKIEKAPLRGSLLVKQRPESLLQERSLGRHFRVKESVNLILHLNPLRGALHAKKLRSLLVIFLH